MIITSVDSKKNKNKKITTLAVSIIDGAFMIYMEGHWNGKENFQLSTYKLKEN